MDPAATEEPLIAEDVKADICMEGGGGGGDQGGKWEVKSKEGAERLAGVFCFIPVCLRGKRIRQQKKKGRE